MYMYLVAGILFKLPYKQCDVLWNVETVSKTVQNYLFPNVELII